MVSLSHEVTKTFTFAMADYVRKTVVNMGSIDRLSICSTSCSASASSSSSENITCVRLWNG